MPYKLKPCPKCGKPIARNRTTCFDCVDWQGVNKIPGPNDFTLIRECKQCNQPFRITHSRQRYCIECRTIECQICGTPFVTVFGKERVTCSPTCSKQLNSAPTLICQYCGRPFPQRDGKSTKNCGDDCRYASMRKYPDGNGPTRRSWEYKRWRRQVFKRDDYTCQECGATKMLHAHHLQSWDDHPALAYDVDNGQTLCHACHIKVHGGQPITYAGTDRLDCARCGKPITGTGKSPYCKSCAMRLSPKAIASRLARARNKQGQFANTGSIPERSTIL